MKPSELLFELSHPTRLEIFRLLENPMRMTKVAEQVKANAPEVSRHLDRLRAAGLVERVPDGSYRVSLVGRLVLGLLPSLEFLADHWDYFHEHDLSRLPPTFLARLGDLKHCTRSEGLYCNLEAGSEVLESAETRFTAVADELPPDSFHVVSELRRRVPRGLTLRVIVEEGVEPPKGLELGELAYFRVVPKLPAVLCVSDTGACLGFPEKKGRMDPMVGFSSRDEHFVRWCADLAEFLWNRGAYVKVSKA